MGSARVMRLGLAVAVAAMLSVPAAVRAGEDSDDRDNDHDLARELYEHGEIEALHDVLRVLRQKGVGEIVDVELVQSVGRWIYRFQVIGPDGRRFSIDVDAAAARPQRKKDDH